MLTVGSVETGALEPVQSLGHPLSLPVSLSLSLSVSVPVHVFVKQRIHSCASEHRDAPGMFSTQEGTGNHLEAL